MSLFKKALHASPAYQAVKLGSKITQKHDEQKQQVTPPTTQTPQTDEKSPGFFDNLKQKADENNAKMKVKQQGRKDEKVATQEARGKELGYVAISYMGGYDTQRRYNAKLRFYENQVEYSSMGKPVKDLVIPASEVASIEVGGQQQTNSRISVTRMATLGIFSLAAPKRTKIKDTAVTLGLKDGRQVFFHTKQLTEFEVHGKLANAISYYHSLQAKQAASQQPVNSPTLPPTDNASEIMKYATLYKRGAITEAEYQAKKQQLLGL